MIPDNNLHTEISNLVADVSYVYLPELLTALKLDPSMLNKRRLGYSLRALGWVSYSVRSGSKIRKQWRKDDRYRVSTPGATTSDILDILASLDRRITALGG